ncbi:MAG: membrane protein insertase YidC [Sphingobacteriales bacterium]|nr:MAG: membrane protein insertase YidC [Sphingobacteriales bacterium]
MDRNSIIGFLLLVGLAVGYIFYSQNEAEKYNQIKTEAAAKEQKAKAQSNAAATAVIQDTSSVVDSTLPAAFRGSEQIVKIANNVITLDITTKGAYPVAASLLEYKTYNDYVGKKDTAMKLFSGNGDNKLVFKIPVDGKEIWSDELNFTPQARTADSLPLVMVAQVGQGKSVILTYSLSDNNYMMDASLKIVGMNEELGKISTIPVQWATKAMRTEKDLASERRNAQVHYRLGDGEHDYFTFSNKPQRTIEDPLQWMGVKTHFFNSTIIAKTKNFTNGSYDSQEPKEDTTLVVKNISKLGIPVTASNDFSFDFNWYIGPNDYNILKSYKVDMEEMIQFGFGLFAFVKYIVKWLILPLFTMLNGFIPSVGIVIILMTLIIRIFLSFLTYKSQLSAAKMRVLKPQIDTLKEKHGHDQQAMGMEQMKLYRSAGVNPLGGCLPLLFQMPFLLSMYYFFPSALNLRQARFLWAEDLSTFDNILNLGFSIPFYGNHVSLFTLLMTVSSLLLAIYSKQMTAGQEMSGPNAQVLKWMPFVMPVMFLGWFNNFAAGLTFYYFLSNMLSLAQQFIIQKFFINEEKILSKIKENQNKPAATSKWQQRLEEIQKQQQNRGKNAGK